MQMLYYVTKVQLGLSSYVQFAITSGEVVGSPYK